ncbi:Rpn family recombination-promoting nuclease/putative transposase [Nocardia sp. CA2R105]|uniref:Rpn family recombination-promoting nuclease/putative transposase n=1 Tax=Nocardia coffeae TaxID=2873381 RepID=UPI001CA7222E|nr:Rpn family recombination-promoting nuclease/putative transposase [Nocardia coffeae]MBY8860975.1 Rpn family recombination-promoting nuclease/putative transposase [Nocardia coffeae]
MAKSFSCHHRVSALPFRSRVKGRPGYIYCLLEHQSGPDRFMAFRMLEYTVRIWSKYLADNHKAHELDPGNVPRTTTLPVVIPVVLHVNGEGATWSATAPTELADLYDIDSATRAALGPHPARLEFFLDDVAAQDVGQIRARAVPSAEAIVTTADRMEARGEARGKATGRMELLLDQMTAKFGVLPTAVIERVRSAAPTQIDTWATRILTASTLEELLA